MIRNIDLMLAVSTLEKLRDIMASSSVNDPDALKQMVSALANTAIDFIERSQENIGAA
jgi:transcription elongation factor GreA-like protein